MSREHRLVLGSLGHIPDPLKKGRFVSEWAAKGTFFEGILIMVSILLGYHPVENN